MNADMGVDPDGRRTGHSSALISLEDSVHAARSLRAWPRAMHVALTAQVVQAAHQWAERWELPSAFEGLSGQQDGTSFDGRDPAAADHWSAMSSEVPGRSLWWGTWVDGNAVPLHQLLSAAMFGDSEIGHADHSLADALLTQALDDWRQRLSDVFGMDATTPDGLTPSPRDFPALDGAVMVRLSWLAGELRIIIGGDLMESWAKAPQHGAPRAAPEPRSAFAERASLLRALDDLSMTLSAELVPVAIDVGALTLLEVGDVLCTGHPLETPLVMRAVMGAHPPSSVAVCSGYLGARDGRRALELTAVARRR